LKKCRILIPIGCRSDEGLSAPIVKRLKKNDKFHVITINLIAGVFYGSYGYGEQEIWEEKPDIVFILGDRIEMTAMACASFHNKTPIAHYYGGVLNDPIATLDDINRHCISLWSDIQFVESNISAMCLENLFVSILKKSNSHVVGITHMEDVEIDESLVPKEEYDLVLYNPTTMYVESWEINTHRKTIIIGSNPDGIIKNLKPTYSNLPRPLFLGLLKNCTQFITNSSAAIYEAPYFLNEHQIVMIGDRNKNRPNLFFKHDKYLASELIEQHLEKWWTKKNE